VIPLLPAQKTLYDPDPKSLFDANSPEDILKVFYLAAKNILAGDGCCLGVVGGGHGWCVGAGVSL